MSENPLSAADQAIDHQLSDLGSSVRFILDVTPVDADDVRESFLEEPTEPSFTYRELTTDPEVLQTMLAGTKVSEVDDTTLGALLRNKHRELELQLSMLRARDSEDFRHLSVELYGGIAPNLLSAAESIMERVSPTAGSGVVVDAEQFLAVAELEIEHYRTLEPDIDIHAEIRLDSTGVMVSENVLLIGPESATDAARVEALVHHEVGTHLVTQVNGSRQPIRTLGTGLAGYDETQEGLAVLAEVACGGLTPNRLRQLAARVLTVHRMLAGDTFVDCWQQLVDADVSRTSAFTTTMRVFRAGGLTKDAIYLRGLLDLLGHLRDGGSLAPFWLGKFALVDLPLIEDLLARGILNPPALVPRWYDNVDGAQRLAAAASTTDPTHLIKGIAS
ncbi:flavohemoglobin expression-modulating QEGLA motif protein [Tessaracoccus sp.]